jgi:primosomal protein DnaI
MTLQEVNEFSIKDIVNEEVDMNSYINKLVKELKDDIEVYEQLRSLNLTMGEVKDNIGKLTDYREDYNYCKSCPGIEKCAKKTPHISMYIVKEGNYIATKYEPCKKIMEQIKLDSRYLVADFPSEWRYSNFSTIDLSANRRPVIRRIVKDIMEDKNDWVFIKGNHKVGKSFLLVAATNEFISKTNQQAAVINARTRFKELADLSISNPNEFTKNLVALSNVGLLVIDDFGDEYKSEYIRDQILMPLLIEREHKNKLTFFTSNYSIKEIQELYGVGKSGGEIRAKQLANILEEMCGEEFDLTGASIYRK